MQNRFKLLRGYWLKGIGYYANCSEELFIIDSSTDHKKIKQGTIIRIGQSYTYEVLAVEIKLVTEQELAKEQKGNYTTDSLMRESDEPILRAIFHLYVKDINPDTVNWDTYQNTCLEPLTWKPARAEAYNKKDTITKDEALELIMSNKKTRDRLRPILNTKRITKQQVETFLNEQPEEAQDFLKYKIEEEK